MIPPDFSYHEATKDMKNGEEPTSMSQLRQCAYGCIDAESCSRISRRVEAFTLATELLVLRTISPTTCQLLGFSSGNRGINIGTYIAVSALYVRCRSQHEKGSLYE